MALGDAAREKGLDKRKEIKALLELTTDSVLANELIKEEVLSKITVTESQAKDYYAQKEKRLKNSWNR